MKYFSEWFAFKIARTNEGKRPLAQLIIAIGRVAVALGIIVSLVTMATGWGAQRSIKNKLTDFSGALTISPYHSNFVLNVDSLVWNDSVRLSLIDQAQVSGFQRFALKSGIIRTTETFEGVVLKGLDEGFQAERFESFLSQGSVPDFSGELNKKVMLSQKIADALNLEIDSSFTMVFLSKSQRPIYRNFNLAGTFKTDIKELDDVFVLTDIRNVQRINKWDDEVISGVDIFVDNPDEAGIVADNLNQVLPFNMLARSAQEEFSFLNDWIAIFDTNVTVILVIMFLVAIINIVMVLLILIIERTPSIGILKTLGTENAKIRRIFITYTLLVLIPGMFWGNLIGIGILLIQKFFGVIKLPAENYYISEAPVYLSWDYILFLNLAILFLSAVTLILPSYYVSKISPTKAIRFE